MLTFAAGGLAAVLSARVVAVPVGYLCVLVGGVSLAAPASALVLGVGAGPPLMVPGLGGVERWVVYPVLLWAPGFGGSLLGDATRRRAPGSVVEHPAGDRKRARQQR